MSKLTLLLILLIISFITLSQSSSAVYDVINFGAKPDGETDSTQPFLMAWSSACNSTRPATVQVPQGQFLIKSITFNGSCRHKITFQIDGTIVAPSDYNSLANSGYWILFYKVTSGLTLSGGTLNANGAAYWACKKSAKSCPPGARTLSFVASSNVMITGLTSINSQIFHVAIDQCKNLILQNLNISASNRSPNTDGIHIQSSTEITISNSLIKTGDDCISLGPGSKNLWIENIACGPGHGISIGSLGEHTEEDGVQNVTVTGAVFTRTQNGLRIKTWAKLSTGFARKIYFLNSLMTDVDNPIIIDQNYCPDHKICPHQGSGVNISEVTYKNITGTSGTQVAMNFGCSPRNLCTGIDLQDIKLTYLNKAATTYCKNALGSSTGVVVPRSCL